MIPINPTSLLDALLTGGIPGFLQSRMPRAEQGPFPTSFDVDQYGYPSEQVEDHIRMIPYTRAREWLHDVFPDLWRTLPSASIKVHSVRDAYTVEPRMTKHIRIATGGWSGCESIVNAVLDHFALQVYLTEQRCGGGYTFEVPDR